MKTRVALFTLAILLFAAHVFGQTKCIQVTSDASGNLSSNTCQSSSPTPLPSPTVGLPANWQIAPITAPYGAAGSLGIGGYYQVEDNHSSGYINLHGKGPNGAEIGITTDTGTDAGGYIGSYNFSWESASPGIGDTRAASIAGYRDGSMLIGTRLAGNSTQPDYWIRFFNKQLMIGSTTLGGATLNVTGNTTGSGYTQIWRDKNGSLLGRMRDDGKLILDGLGKGVIMRSQSGSCFEAFMSDAGSLTTKAVSPCP